MVAIPYQSFGTVYRSQDVGKELPTLRNIPEERISNQFRGGNLKSRKLRVFT
jgi:hypothetical protein